MHSNNSLVLPTTTFPQPGDLVDEREAAAILGLAIRTLRNWRWKRQGPRFRKLGLRAVRYSRGDLTAFIAGDALLRAPLPTQETNADTTQRPKLALSAALTPRQHRLAELRKKLAAHPSGAKGSAG